MTKILVVSKLKRGGGSSVLKYVVDEKSGRSSMPRGGGYFDTEFERDQHTGTVLSAIVRVYDWEAFRVIKKVDNE